MSKWDIIGTIGLFIFLLMGIFMIVIYTIYYIPFATLVGWGVGIWMCCFSLYHIIDVLNINKTHKLYLKSMMDNDFNQIDDLTPYEFEKWVSNLLEIQGFKTQVTPQCGDFGVDVIAEKNYLKIGIQVKKFSKPVGIRAVQEIVSGMHHYNCNKGWVVSTAPYFTNAAIQLAKEHNIKLINRYELGEYFQEIKTNYFNKNNNTDNEFYDYEDY